MDFWSVLESRRSIRRFKSIDVEPEKIQKCLEAAFQAPSSFNSQPWKFYVATGKTRDELIKIIKKFPIYIAELMDHFPILKDPEKQEFVKKFAENLGGAPVLIVVTMPETTNPMVEKYQLIACGAAIENFHLAATYLGLGTVCITSAGFVEEEVLNYLGVKGEKLVSVLPLGYPDESPQRLPRKNRAVYL